MARHALTGLVGGVITRASAPRGSCVIRGARPHLWALAAEAMGLEILGIEWSDRVFGDLLTAAGVGGRVTPWTFALGGGKGRASLTWSFRTRRGSRHRTSSPTGIAGGVLMSSSARRGFRAPLPGIGLPACLSSGTGRWEAPLTRFGVSRGGSRRGSPWGRRRCWGRSLGSPSWGGLASGSVLFHAALQGGSRGAGPGSCRHHHSLAWFPRLDCSRMTVCRSGCSCPTTGLRRGSGPSP